MSIGNIQLQNGQLVISALKKLRRPSKVKRVATFLANNMGMNSNTWLESVVEDTLEAGVRIGYVHKNKHGFYEPQLRPKQLKLLLHGQGRGRVK